MAIVRLQSENVKRVKAINIEPNGKPVVIIGGKNGQGKTSLMDSIAWALNGKRSIQDRPVREGADSAQIILETEDMVVRRVFAADGSTKLTVTNREGARFAKPQDMLDKLIGSLSFDPLAFSRMKKKEKKEREESLCELLGIDTRRLDAEREIAFGDRTIVNREVKSLAAQVEGLAFHDDAPAEPLDPADVRKELDAAKQHNAAQDEVVEAFYAAEDDMKNLESDAEEVATEIERLEQLLAAKREEASAINTKIELQKATVAEREAAAADVEKIDEDAIIARLEQIGEINAKVRDNADYDRKRKELAAKEAESAALTQAINEIDAKKAEMLRTAKYPIPELSIDAEHGIMLGGMPWDQASSAEQLRASVAICMESNKGFPVALIRDGSLLDDDSLALVERMAVERGFQVWMERVGDGEECTVIISEGDVVRSSLNGSDGGKSIDHQPDNGELVERDEPAKDATTQKPVARTPADRRVPARPPRRRASQ